MEDTRRSYRPAYAITPRLASRIAEVARLATEVERFPVQRLALTALERAALERRVHASVSLEGNPLSETEVARLLRQPPSRPREAAAREVLNYAQAVRLAARWARKPVIGERKLLGLHAAVGRGLIRPAGRYRTRPMIVRDPDLGAVVHRAPGPEHVPALTRAFLRWADGPEARALPWPILGGIVHARLARIHPFADGNGRVARLATFLVLQQQECRFLDQVALEPFYNADRRAYFRALRSLDAGRHDPMTRWLEYFVGGIAQALAAHRRALPRRAGRILPARRGAPPVRLRREQLELAAQLPRGGTVTAAEYADQFRVSLRTAQYHLLEMVGAGLLRPHGTRKGRYYDRQNPAGS